MKSIVFIQPVFQPVVVLSPPVVVVVYCSNERPFDPKMKRFTESMLASPGLGTRCLEGEPLRWVTPV